MATLTDFTTSDKASLEQELSEYREFGLAIDEMVEDLRLARGEYTDVAAILKKILRKETPALDLAAAVEDFGRSVLDESYFNLISQEILSSLPNRPQCATLLLELLKTYLNRKLSLIRYHHEYAASDYVNSVFNLKTLHDRLYAGVRCLEIKCDAIVTGRPGETAWITVETHNGRSFISPAGGYESWSDESFRPKIAPSGHLEERPRFSVVFPITLRRQVELATDIKILIPYGALDIGEDISRVSFCVSLKDRGGKKLVSRWLEDFSVINWPRQNPLALPSPHSLDLWPDDPRSGTRFRELEVVERSSTEAILRSRFEVVGNKGKDIFIKYRALTGQGQNPEGGYIATSKIAVSANYSTLQHSQRISCKGLAIGAGEAADLMIEAALYDSMNRKLCGTLIRPVV